MQKTWFGWLELGCAGAAAAVWYLLPQAGAWPLLIGLVPWVIRPFATGIMFPRTPFDWPLLLFLATAGLAVWSAYDRETAWAKFWLIVAAVLLFYAVANWVRATTFAGRRADSVRSAWLPALLGTAVAFYFFATHDWAAFPAEVGFLTAIGSQLQTPLPDLPVHRLHPNVVGGLLALALPFGLVLLPAYWRRRAWSALVLAGVASGMMLLALLFGSSRGAWLALAAAGGLALWWLLAGLVRGVARRLVFAVGLAGGVVLVGIGLLIWPDTAVALLARLPGFGDGLSRLDLYRSSLPLVAEYPLIGAGLGGFMMLYSTYALLVHVGFLVHAHNLFLDVAIEQGLVGLLALAWMWGVFGLLLWREMGRGRVRPLVAAAALALVTVLVHGLLEDALYGSRAVLLLFVPLAYASALPEVEMARARSWRWVLPVVGVAAVMVATVGALPSLRSFVVSNLGAVAQSRAELSVYAWPEWPIQDAVRRAVDESTAVAYYQQALDLNPDNPAANRRLGQMALSMGAYSEALGYLEAAYAARPWDAATRQLYGEALLVNGRGAEGAALWQTVPTGQDQLAIRRYWYDSIGEAELVERLDRVLAGGES